MNEKKKFDILKRIFNKTELQKLEETLIITVPSGYELFGEFLISKENNKFCVTKYNTALEEYFYNLQNATIFTILYKRNMVADAKRMLELDILLESANADIIRYKDYGSTIEARVIADAKFEEAKNRKHRVTAEITGHLKNTKLWQENRYKEAIK